MRRVVIAFALFLTLEGGAFAQTHGEWRHPRNLYSFQPAVSGWSSLPPPEGLLAVFELASEPGRARMCFVKERPMPQLRGVGQDYLNERTPLFQPSLDGTSAAATRVVDGVAVSAFRFDDLRVVNHYLMFVIADGENVSHHEISCGGTLPVTAENEAAFHAFLDSLQFTPTDQAL